MAALDALFAADVAACAGSHAAPKIQSTKFAASERLKFSATPGFIKLNFINRAGRAQRAAMKFYKAAA